METLKLEQTLLEDFASLVVLHALVVSRAKPEELLPHKDGMSYPFKLAATARTVAEQWVYVRERARARRADKAEAESKQDSSEESHSW